MARPLPTSLLLRPALPWDGFGGGLSGTAAGKKEGRGGKGAVDLWEVYKMLRKQMGSRSFTLVLSSYGRPLPRPPPYEPSIIRGGSFPLLAPNQNSLHQPRRAKRTAARRGSRLPRKV